MTTDELLQLLDRLKATMIAVATGGPRIGEVEDAFARDYDRVATELAERRIQNPLPYRDLWDWYGRWSSGDMPSWQSRRQFVNGLFSDLTAHDTRTAGASAARANGRTNRLVARRSQCDRGSQTT